jgi:hypothetical protein
MTGPALILRCQGRTGLLVFAGGTYQRCARRVLRLYLRELGQRALLTDERGQAVPVVRILAEHGREIDRDEFDFRSRASSLPPAKCKRPSCTRGAGCVTGHCCEGCRLDMGHDRDCVAA